MSWSKRWQNIPAKPGFVNFSLTIPDHPEHVLSSGLGAQKARRMHTFTPDLNATYALVGLPVAEVERDLILATLRQTDGNRTHAALVLGISIRTMRNKLREYAEQGLAIPANAHHDA